MNQQFCGDHQVRHQHGAVFNTRIKQRVLRIQLFLRRKVVLHGRFHSGPRSNGQRGEERPIQAHLQVADHGQQARGEVVIEPHVGRTHVLRLRHREVDRVVGVDAAHHDRFGRRNVRDRKDVVELARRHRARLHAGVTDTAFTHARRHLVLALLQVITRLRPSRRRQWNVCDAALRMSAVRTTQSHQHCQQDHRDHAGCQFALLLRALECTAYGVGHSMNGQLKDAPQAANRLVGVAGFAPAQPGVGA